MLYTFLKIFGSIFSAVFFRLQVTGIENIPARGGFILAPNHRSYLDPPLVAFKVPRKIYFVSKTTLYRKRIFLPLLNGLHAIPLRQQSGAVGLKSAISSLKKGLPVVIFPEGTRNRTRRKFLAGTKGISLLAEAADVPVIPVYISGAARALPYGAIMFRPRAIAIAYGKPLTFDGNSDLFAEKVMSEIIRLSETNG